MRGRKPKPTKLRIASGETRPCRINWHEPKPDPTAPKCPDWLDDEGREHWRKLVKVLADMRVLTVADGDALAAICNTTARMVRAEQKIRESGGEVVLSPKGFPMQNPWLSIYARCQDQLAKLLAEFGLTPSSRTRVHVVDKKSKESAGKARFFSTA